MPQDGKPESDAPLDPERWVAEHGDVLFQFALARARNATVAEDLVQETFLVAWKARQNFAGQAAEQSWLIGILKHKIVDHIRRASRERAPASPARFSPDAGGPRERFTVAGRPGCGHHSRMPARRSGSA